MKILAKLIFGLFRLIFKSKRDLILENLALHQQSSNIVKFYNKRDIAEQ